MNTKAKLIGAIIIGSACTGFNTSWSTVILAPITYGVVIALWELTHEQEEKK